MTHGQYGFEPEENHRRSGELCRSFPQTMTSWPAESSSVGRSTQEITSGQRLDESSGTYNFDGDPCILSGISATPEQSMSAVGHGYLSFQQSPWSQFNLRQSEHGGPLMHGNALSVEDTWPRRNEHESPMPYNSPGSSQVPPFDQEALPHLRSFPTYSEGRSDQNVPSMYDPGQDSSSKSSFSPHDEPANPNQSQITWGTPGFVNAAQNNSGSYMQLQPFDNEYLPVPTEQARGRSMSGAESTTYSSSPITNDRTEPSCRVCGKNFTGEYAKGNLVRHLNNHGQQHPCRSKNCSKVFQRGDARLKHERRHHPELKRQPPSRRK